MASRNSKIKESIKFYNWILNENLKISAYILIIVTFDTLMFELSTTCHDIVSWKFY